MPFVERDQNGEVSAIYRQATTFAQERLALEDPDVMDFLRRSFASEDRPADVGEVIQEELAASDREMVRVIEDVVAALIRKQVILLTDLPEAAQRKLLNRSALRNQLSELGGLVIYSDEVMLP